MSEVEKLVEQAKIICDFMGWPEDGPAWDDAVKLAGQLHKSAYQQGWNDREDDLILGVNRVAPLRRVEELEGALRMWLEALDAGRSEPLFIARDHTRSVLSEGEKG